jgi:hypothetical protein
MVTYNISQIFGLMNQVVELASGLENFTPEETLQINVIIHEPQNNGLMKTTFEFPKKPKFKRSYLKKSGIYEYQL